MYAYSRACLAPGVMSTFSPEVAMPLVLMRCLATASQSSGEPWPLVYLVRPASKPCMAASIIGCGVGNPGSPTVQRITPSGGGWRYGANPTPRPSNRVAVRGITSRCAWRP